MRVLLIPGTTQVALEYIRSVKLRRDIFLYGAGSDLYHPLCREYEDYAFLSSEISCFDYRVVQEILHRYSIDIIVPCHDDWILTLSQMARSLDAICTVPNLDSALILRSKRATYRALSQSIPTPMTYESLTSVYEFPVFLKPDRGQGSRGSQPIHFADGLKEIFSDSLDGTFKEEWLVSEFLPGAEFTVDNFTDTYGNLLYSSTRQRLKTHNGVSSETATLPLIDDSQWAKTISNYIPITGAWYFQYKFDSEGMAKLLEVAARPAGASGINRLFGINLPLMQLQQAMGFELEVLDSAEMVTVKRDSNSGKYNATFENRKFKQIYVDFDDTLVSWKDELPSITRVADFIKKAKEYDRKIILISKHQGSLFSLLEHLDLKDSFDQVVHITDSTPKFNFIKFSDEDILFIDDSFSERRQVKHKFRSSVVVVDPSAFNFDWEAF